MIGEVSRALRHAPGVAGGTDGAARTGEGHQGIMTTLAATRPGEAIGQNAALQVGTQLTLGMRRDAHILPVVAARSKEGFEMVLHRPVERRIGGASSAIGGGSASLRLTNHLCIREAAAMLYLYTVFWSQQEASR